MMKRSVLAIVIAACMMVGNSVFAADIDSMTLEELKSVFHLSSVNESKLLRMI